MTSIMPPSELESPSSFAALPARRKSSRWITPILRALLLTLWVAVATSPTSYAQDPPQDPDPGAPTDPSDPADSGLPADFFDEIEDQDSGDPDGFGDPDGLGDPDGFGDPDPDGFGDPGDPDSFGDPDGLGTPGGFDEDFPEDFGDGDFVPGELDPRDQISLPLSDLQLRDVQSELMVAIETRDHPGVREVLERGEELDLDEGDPSPLATAALLGDPVTLSLLLRHGADPNGRADSPLLEAVRSDAVAIVELLISAGAEVPGNSTHRELFESDLRGPDRAVVFGHLLAAGGDPQVCLEVAVAAEQRGLAETCLTAGASITELDAPMALLSLYPEEERAALLEQLAGSQGRPALLASLLLHGAGRGDGTLVEMLLAEGAEPTLEAATVALDGGHRELALEIADRFAATGADPLALAESGGLSGLADALRARQKNLWIERGTTGALWGLPVLVLVALGWLVAGRARRSPKKLHEAIEADDERNLARLLAAGAEVDSVYQGLTPLHRAVASGNGRIVSALLRRQADGGVKSGDSRGYTPLHLAAERGRVDLAQLLVRGGTHVDVRASDGDTPLFAAALAGEEAMVRWLGDQGAEVEKTMGRGSLLCHAVLSKSPVGVRLLLAQGADPNPHGGRQPLHLAVLGGQPEIVRDLLAAGADRTLRDSSGKTLMEIAIQHQQNDVARVLQGDL